MFSSIALQLIDISDLFPNYPLETGEATPKAYWQWRAQVKIRNRAVANDAETGRQDDLAQAVPAQLFRPDPVCPQLVHRFRVRCVVQLV